MLKDTDVIKLTFCCKFWLYLLNKIVWVIVMISVMQKWCLKCPRNFQPPPLILPIVLQSSRIPIKFHL